MESERGFGGGVGCDDCGCGGEDKEGFAVRADGLAAMILAVGGAWVPSKVSGGDSMI